MALRQAKHAMLSSWQAPRAAQAAPTDGKLARATHIVPGGVPRQSEGRLQLERVAVELTADSHIESLAVLLLDEPLGDPGRPGIITRPLKRRGGWVCPRATGV
jgi:hypothetical protein